MRELETFDIPLIIINILIILIGAYLFFLFIKSDAFNNYQCYNMIIFSFIVTLDNILRIIPFNLDEKTCTNVEKIVAFFIVAFDKLILATLSMQSFIYFLLSTKADFYDTYKKYIFFITLTISIVISGSISLFYIIHNGTVTTGLYYCYCDDKKPKKLIDNFFNAIYLLISVFCSIITLIFINKEKKKAEEGLSNDLGHLFNRNLILLFLNTFAFVESYLIIFDKIPVEYIDFIYILTCLVLALFNSCNEIVYK